MSEMSEQTLTSSPITPEVASHVLWRYDASNTEPSDFIQTLIGMVACGGRDEVLRLVHAYADAMHIAETPGDGVEFLKVLAGLPASSS